jgi:hypothetical protein
MVMSSDQRRITITFGGVPAMPSAANRSTMVWTPSSAVCAVTPICPVHESVAPVGSTTADPIAVDFDF